MNYNRKDLKTNVILHAFDWPYAEIGEQAKEISQLGYRSVLVSPPMKSMKKAQGTKWWQRYQPQDYRVIDNQLGDTEQFSAMVKALSEYGIQVYADVVFNHMANESSVRDDLQYPAESDMQIYAANIKHHQNQRLFGDLREPLFTENDFVEAFGIKDWKNRWQVQNGRITGGKGDPGLPTLRDNDYVVSQQKAYLRALKGLGVKGFRIDAAKHMTLKHLNKVWTEDIANDIHIFGEIITDGGATKQEYELFLQPYLEATQLSAYDFPLFNTIYNAFQPSGDMRSLINPYCFGQALCVTRAITFAITHDIPNNRVFNDLILDEEHEWMAYCYILGRDGGVPLIYTDLDTSGIKNSQGLPRWKSCWKDERMAKMIQFHNSTHGEPMLRVVGDEDFLLFSRGSKGLVGINKSDKRIEISLDWPDSLQALFGNNEVVADNGEIELTLQANSYQMWLTN